jgi:hypothetical protein
MEPGDRDRQHGHPYRRYLPEQDLDLRHLHIVIAREFLVRSSGFPGVFGGYELRDIVC